MFKYILLISILLFVQSDKTKEMFMMFLKMVKKNPMVASNILKSGYPTIRAMIERNIDDDPILKEYLNILDQIFRNHTEFVDEICKVLYKNAFIIDTLEEFDRMSLKQQYWFYNQLAKASGVKEYIFKLLEYYPNIFNIYFHYLAEVSGEEEVVDLYNYIKNHPEFYRDVIEIFENLDDRNKAMELIDQFRGKGIPLALIQFTNLIEEILN